MAARFFINPTEAMDAMDSPQDSARYIQDLAQSLVRMAQGLGVTLVIERVPLVPLAMGHIKHVASAWPARHPDGPPKQR